MTRRIRVLRVITRMNVGGPALHVALLSTRLDPARYETLLVSGREASIEGNMVELGRVAGVRPHIVPSLGRSIGLRDLQALWHVIRIARGFRPDVVHTHLAKAGFVGRIAARLCGARVVVHTYHGSVFRGYFGQREAGMYLAIERALAGITTRVIAVTERQRRELIDLSVAPSAKIVEIPLGLDLAAFRSLPARDDARTALGIAPQVPVVGIVARLVPIKDVATFLRAFARLAHTFPEAVGLVVGDGEQHAELARLAHELELGGRVRFLGWRADMPLIYSAIDVAVLTSLNEGSPVTAIEAMAAARPVVATEVGGVPDVVVDGETGFLVPPGRPDAIARAIEDILRLPDRGRELGAAGRVRALDLYDAHRLVRDIDALYTDLLGDTEHQ